jgi:hypothetical protein
LVLVACGGSGPNEEEVARYKRQGAEHVHKEERLRKLEKELKHIKNKGQGGSAVPPRTESAPPGSVPAPAPAPTKESCGGELEVNSNTTCPFAANVEAEYFAEIGSGSGSIEAYSPAREQVYVMFCTGSPHECTGGDNAAVYFP